MQAFQAASQQWTIMVHQITSELCFPVMSCHCKDKNLYTMTVHVLNCLSRQRSYTFLWRSEGRSAGGTVNQQRKEINK